MIATLHQIFGALVVVNFFLAIIAAELYTLTKRDETAEMEEKGE